MSHKFISVALCVVVMALSIAGCTQGASSAAPIKIGIIGPQTGASAETGQGVAHGAQIAVDKINAAGGINGRKIELVVADGKNDPAESLTAANKLMLQDKVQALVCCVGSTATISVLPAAEKNATPLLVETASAPKITQLGNKFVHRISATSQQEAKGVEATLPKIGFDKVALLGVNSDWGRGAEAAFTEAVKNQGGEIVSSQFFEGNAVDFYPQLTSIKNSGADSIILTADSSLIVMVLRQMKDLQIDLPVLSTGGSDFTDGVIELAGAETAEGIRAIAYFNPSLPEVAADPAAHKEFVKTWQDNKFLWRKMPEGARGYDAINVLAAAIKSIKGEVTRESIQEALKTIDHKGITGELKFDENGQATRNIFLVRAENGKTVLEK